jgi:hypothetical protein
MKGEGLIKDYQKKEKYNSFACKRPTWAYAYI